MLFRIPGSYGKVRAAITSAAQYIGNVADLLLTTDQVWGAAKPVPLTFSTSITPDFSTFINGYFTATSNFTLNAPTNGKQGQFGVIEIYQDATGSRVITFNAAWHFSGTTPTLSTASGALDLLYYYVDHTGTVRASLVKGS